MRLRTFLFSTLTALAVISCGGGGGSPTAGGIGGTGVSYGPVTAFGSVIVNGTEFKTDSATFTVDGTPVGTGSAGQSKLSIGMVVSVTNDGNGNAKSVSFSDNAQGPVSNIGTTGFDVLGITVTVNKLTVYSGLTDVNSNGVIDIKDLANDDIVEISGQHTGTNAVTATRIEKVSTCGTLAGRQIEVKGTVTSIIDANKFTLGTGGAALTVIYPSNGLNGLNVGDYVEVKSSACPTAGTLTASAIDASVAEGPDLSELDHKGEGELEIKGIVDNYQVTTPGCTFSVNGQRVSDSNNTDCQNLANDAIVDVQGILDSAGVLVAASVSVENASQSEANIDFDVTARVASVTKTGPTPADGTLTLINQITVLKTSSGNTSFESELTPLFNLDSIVPGITCVEVKAINNTGFATTLWVGQKDAASCP